MKFCVLAELTLDTPAKRDLLSNEIKTFIGKKIVWGATTVVSNINDKGKPTTMIEVRFSVKSNMDNLYDLIKDRMIRVPVLHGRVSKHDCPHDETPARPCVITELYKKL